MNTQKQKFSATSDGKELKFHDKIGISIWLELLKDKELEVEIGRIINKRSSTQNNSLHKLFDLVSEECEENGVSVSMIITALNKKGVDVIPSPEFIKELWRVIQIAKLKKYSTTQLDKNKEIDLVYEAFCKFIGENWGIYVPFPSVENPIYQ